MTTDKHAIPLIQTEKASLWYHRRTNIVHHELRAFVYGVELRRILDTGLDAMIEHGGHKWLSDDRGNGALTSEDSAWAQGDWAPRVIAAGWKQWAVVWPAKMIGQMNMRRWIADYAARGVEVQAFEQPEVAMSWLESRN